MSSSSTNSLAFSSVNAVLLDITGVLYNSGVKGAIDGSIEAVRLLKGSGIRVRFCSNETQCTRAKLAAKLNSYGYSINESEITMPVPAVKEVISREGLRPYVVLHPDALGDIEGLDEEDPNCVVLGDVGSPLTYPMLNGAFRVLIEKPDAVLFSLGNGKYYKEGDGLAMDVGAFRAALEYSSGATARIVGKPSREYFEAALRELELEEGGQQQTSGVVMVGDDIVGDIGGAMNAGLRGVLVRTGKYRPSDEKHETVKPTAVVDNLLDFAQRVVDQRQRTTVDKQ